MSKLVPDCSKTDGTASNTSIAVPAKIIVNPAKHWCFTLNNYTKSDIDELCSKLSDCEYVFQEETGESGTPHLQGYVNFPSKVRPKGMFSNKGIHWEKSRCWESSIAYCCKEETRTGKIFHNIDLPRIDKRLLSFVPRPWQQKLYEMLLEEPDDRSIVWVYDKVGKAGKSLFCKWLNYKDDRFLSVTMNKSADILTVVEKRYVCYLIDLPRCYDVAYTPFNAIEQIKNGFVTEGKLKKTARVLSFAPPHVVVFSNDLPDTSKMSEDRWIIIKL